MRKNCSKKGVEKVIQKTLENHQKSHPKSMPKPSKNHKKTDAEKDQEKEGKALFARGAPRPENTYKSTRHIRPLKKTHMS